ncbi:MAG: adenine deaminase [Turicibacter sp.]|nr:adenine deaminase [Turicibacter sp.]
MKEQLIELRKKIKCAANFEKASLVIKNITMIDVFQNARFTADVAIESGYIVGIGTYEGIEEIDGTNRYICPGLIDAHAHIESSLISPKEYYKEALKHGITSMITDPHEIANVLGVKGIELMLQLTKDIPFDMYVMLPSCVPATTFENSGATLLAADLNPLYAHEKVIGLAEVMNFPAVLNGDEDMLKKLLDASTKGYRIDGHGAGFDLNQLNAYLTAGILTDHECHTAEEVIERLRRGMYVLMREGSVAKNLKDLIQAASLSNSRRICFCTDDKHINDLIEEGSIDQAIKIAVKSGLSIETAIQMSTLNTAECYQLKDKGAIAPGFVADFIILDDLETFSIQAVYKNGQCVVKEGELQFTDEHQLEEISFENSVHLPKELNEQSFMIDASDAKYLNAIEIIPNKLETIHRRYELQHLKASRFIESMIEKDLLKVAVIERHHQTGNIGLGMLKGLKLQKGAIATTISHDSHNLIVCGTNNADMLVAARQLEAIGGGIVVVLEGQVLAQIQLEIAGLMTNRKAPDVIKDLDALYEALHQLSPTLDFNPFLTLSFLTLPVIPSLKITDKGLFDVEKFDFIQVVE